MDKLPTRAQNLFTYNLRRLRTRLGLTQSELSERAHISTSFLGTLETGRKFPSPETMDSLSEALGVKLQQFFQEPGQNSGDKLVFEVEQALGAFQKKMDANYVEMVQAFLKSYGSEETAAENPEPKLPPK